MIPSFRCRALVGGLALLVVSSCSSDASPSSTGPTTTTTSKTGTTLVESSTTRVRTPVGSDIDAQDYVDAVSDIAQPDNGALSTEQAQCLAAAFVDVIGVDALRAAGVGPDEFAQGDLLSFGSEVGLDEATANELFDQFEPCDVDLAEILRKLLTGGQDLAPEQATCIDQILTNERVRASYVAQLSGSSAPEDLASSLQDCVAATQN